MIHHEGKREREREKERVLGGANVLGNDNLGETVLYNVTPGHNRKLCFLSDGDAAAGKSILGTMLCCKFRSVSSIE